MRIFICLLGRGGRPRTNHEEEIDGRRCWALFHQLSFDQNLVEEEYGYWS